MRKLLLLCFLVAASTAHVSAQAFGVRLGVNATGARFDLDGVELDTDGQTNLAFGAFVNIPLIGAVFSVQPEFTYLNRGYSRDLDVVTPGGSRFEQRQTLSYVDLGALARLNFGSTEDLGFYVAAGPQFSYAISGEFTEITGGTETERDIDFSTERIRRSELQFALVGGVSYDFGLRVFAEGRYNGSLTNQYDIDAADVRQRALGVHAGIMIPFGPK